MCLYLDGFVAAKICCLLVGLADEREASVAKQVQVEKSLDTRKQLEPQLAYLMEIFLSAQTCIFAEESCCLGIHIISLDWIAERVC